MKEVVNNISFCPFVVHPALGESERKPLGVRTGDLLVTWVLGESPQRRSKHFLSNSH